MTKAPFLLLILLMSALAMTGCQPSRAEAVQPAASSTAPSVPSETAPATASEAASATPGEAATETLVAFSLETRAAEGKLLFVGVGGDIDGVVNPDLVVPPGAKVHVTLINGDGIPHDLFVPDFDARTRVVSAKGRTAEVDFAVEAGQTGAHAYFCTLPGHRQAGQEGRLMVEGPGK